MKRIYNWRPSIPDHRDHIYEPKAWRVPARVDLSAGMSPIRDQGQLGCCVGESSCAGVEFLERQYGIDRHFEGSVLYAYYNARKDKRSDSGAEIRDSIKAMAFHGISRVNLWGFVPSKFAIKPPKSAYQDGLNRKITGYQRARSVFDIKEALASHHPVLIGFTCFESLETPAVDKSGIVPMPAADESTIGGHAICLVGYDDAKALFKFKNSWGKTWGDKGYGYLPYDYVRKSLADDFWVLIK